MQYLMFHLYGPLQSWGEAAPGEVRQSADHPTKSGVLGLVAAALGLERDADADHALLDTDLGFAVRVDAPGRRMTDYHTVQAPPKSKLRPQTRRDQLRWVMRSDLETMLTSREYLADACFTVALWSRQDLRDLAGLAAALERPVFPLYLGRRNCPLGWPMRPQLVDAETLIAAYAQFPLHGTLRERLAQARTTLVDKHPMLYWEGETAVGMEKRLTVPRGDGLVSRQRRSFSMRQEHSGRLEGGV